MSGMVDPTPGKRELILQAAEVRFARYGFRRTSMEDIAREAGISRAGLYLEFRNKEAIFASVSRALGEASLAAAADALARRAPLADRLEAALLGKNLRTIELVHGSPHGAELMDQNSRLCGTFAAEVEARFRALMTRTLRRAARSGEIDPSAVGLSSTALADVFVRAASGLKGPGVEGDAYAAAVAAFVRVFLAGLAPAAPPRARRRAERGGTDQPARIRS